MYSFVAFYWYIPVHYAQQVSINLSPVQILK